ncbi:GyrI-like domain-containing protein [Streptomyces sp. NPDC047000]|uniref:GyrI-like domain-containing protein n=1 Tax=Streptomyces sp. NPDC047000 TaxID=3155474 RepID=UPI003407726D
MSHLGSYDDEAPVLHELHHTHLDANGLRASGLHHEAYLNDPRKTAPEKKTSVTRAASRFSATPHAPVLADRQQVVALEGTGHPVRHGGGADGGRSGFGNRPYPGPALLRLPAVPIRPAG